jgi:hypothetical protein
LNHHPVGWVVVAGIVVGLVALGVWGIDRFKKSPNRGSFLRVDPPPPPPSERIIKDEEDEEAASGPSKV